MNRDADTITARAARWHLATASDDMDWDGFADWLDADPRHRAAYDEIALTDAALGEVGMAEEAPAPLAANDDERPPRRRGWAVWGGGALAASLAALALVTQLSDPAPVTYATQSGAQTIALADGSRIALAPHSRLTIEGRRQDRIALEGGAWFEIRHDPSRQLVIDAGGVAISDVGTSFDVQTTAGQVAVEVAEGQVALSSDRLEKPVQLVAGHAFRLDVKAGTAVTRPLEEGEAGEWREGRLTYRNEALGLVAADLARYAGVRIELSEGIANRQFSGTLAVGNGEGAVRDLAQLMGLGLERSGTGYRLVAR
ncbi:FecR family protein [Erythrobacter sp. NE805]|uniref:FecR family protein n=1 Tax=Erythrobacter sp. NE805 TaxID=3389875 RepID=UPI00396B3EE2